MRPWWSPGPDTSTLQLGKRRRISSRASQRRQPPPHTFFHKEPTAPGTGPGPEAEERAAAEGATWAPGVCMCVCRRGGPTVGAQVAASARSRALQLLGDMPAEQRQADAQGPERAGRLKESFTGERRTEKGPLIYTKANPIPLAATDGPSTCQAADYAGLRVRPYTAAAAEPF